MSPRTWPLLAALVLVIAAPASASPPAVSACADAASPGCRCERGDSDACVEVNEAAFARGDHAMAVLSAVALCDRGAAAACLQAARFLDRRRVPPPPGRTAAQLRARGVELLETACARGDAEACFRAGKQLATGEPADVARGRAHLTAACSAGHGRACAALAGPGTADVGAEAGQLHDRACQLGSFPSCTLAGDAIAARDPRRAQRLYIEACAHDDATGCARSAAGHAARGQHREAAAAHLAACELGRTSSCAEAGRALTTGRGIARDPARARDLLDRACSDSIGDGCLALAGLVERGVGGPRRLADAAALYRRACDLDATRGCAEATRMARAKRSAGCTTVAACARRCEEQVAAACTQQARLDRGPCDDRAPLFARACRLGDPAGCLAAGNAVAPWSEAGHAEPPDARARWYELACRGGADEACLWLDVLAARDAPAAERAAIVGRTERRCADGRDPLACTQLGHLIDDAEPVRAERLWREACDRRHGAACGSLAAHRHDYSPHAGGTCCADAYRERIADEAAARAAATTYAADKAGWTRLRTAACSRGDSSSCFALADSTNHETWRARGDAVARSRCGREGP
jgi:TPR repeat protein